LVLPPFLAVCGRGIFWPFVPRPAVATEPAGSDSEHVTEPAASAGAHVTERVGSVAEAMNRRINGAAQADESAPTGVSTQNVRQLPAEKPGIWRRIATTVVGKPLPSLIAGVAVLGIMMTGLFGTTIGLDQVEKFRVQSESAAGLQTLSQHFAPGEAQPI